jgi:type I restriction enzyme R subunit
MTKTNTKEIGFEEFIENELVAKHGYHIRSPRDNYDKKHAMDTELVLEFVRTTQPEEWKQIEEQYGADAPERFLARVDEEIESQGLLNVLREGVKDRGVTIRLAHFQPQTGMNPEAQKDFDANILSVVRQLKYSEQNENSIDVVLFINGLPLFTAELKNQFTGQNVLNAVRQYQTDRDPKEKLLSFKRCLTHFAVDTELVLMSTKLSGLKTYFLPFNKGYKESAGNPLVEGKYKTHYLWEVAWSKSSVLDLVSRFIQDVWEEKELSNGKKVKENKLIFPRYHQLDTVRRLISDARENGPGRNYLIQHSAGSGKSNTIAWAAHRLSELHDEHDQKVFDGVVVITDRRVLDRQLSETVESFSQVRGVVKHVESSAELREALEKGTRIITSTLQKFPVIVESIDTIEGTNFAVIVDEAHSSQSGESAADLREVLTLEDAEREQEKQEKAFKTVEDKLIERMKARKIKAPNVSFFAFTATPKQKTLELFGVQSPVDGKFYPFSLYSMKQAIEERFILDVLKNYTTYETYFGLLKKIEDDPEFDKKKAERLLVGYVERHEHAIGKKTEIMVRHFEEKIASKDGGKAKAMIVTKSRLHAVRYKLAFDKYLQEQGYSHKAMVAFSGTVKDEGREYTEAHMNGVSEKQTADEFKKDECKFLIVAEKFQTGFDQPLLMCMYVDKKLSGVSAVQTLSRLNRIHPPLKEEVFVLDFVNTTDDIEKAFQPYYTTTVLSEATDPNILHNLERDALGYKLFETREVEGFVEMYMTGATPDQLNAMMDAVVERARAMLPEERADFKSKAADYNRKYAFISQIVTFEDPALEKLYIFLKYLLKKLPKEKDALPKEVLEAVDMELYRIADKGTREIKLAHEAGEIEPMGVGGSKWEVHEEMDALSKIVKEINERYGTNFNTDDRVILNDLSERLVSNIDLSGTIRANSKDSAKIKFDQLFNDELVRMLNSHFELYKKLDENPELRKFVNDRIFEHVSKRVELAAV